MNFYFVFQHDFSYNNYQNSKDTILLIAGLIYLIMIRIFANCFIISEFYTSKYRFKIFSNDLVLLKPYMVVKKFKIIYIKIN